MPTKKTTTKKATKKVAKKTTKKATNKKRNMDAPVLACAEGEACFWTTDGQILSDLQDLRDALEHMSEEVFSHHVTKEKNDFADWIESVLQDGECATKVRKSKKPNTAHKVVVSRLKVYGI